MKTPLYIMLLLLSTSCVEKLYNLQHLPYEAEHFEALFKQFVSVDSLQTARIYSFEFVNCEVEVNGIFLKVLDIEENCDGERFGKHHIDLIEFKVPEGKKVFLSSVERNLKQRTIGPTMLYEGFMDTTAFEGDSIMKFDTQYAVFIQSGKIKYPIKKRAVKLSVPFARGVPIKKDVPDSLTIDQVIIRRGTAIGGEKPQAFKLRDLINRDIVFVEKK